MENCVFCEGKNGIFTETDQAKAIFSDSNFHLIPRTFEDNLYRKTQKNEAVIFKALTEEEATKVKKFLKG